MNHERIRSVDLSKLSVEEADRLSVQIGEKIKLICEKSIEEANRLLSIYGMKAQMQIVIEELTKIEVPASTAKPTQVEAKPAKKPRKPRSKKADNL